MSTAATPGGYARRWHALATLCAGFFLLLVDGTIISVATPTFMDAFGVTAAQVMWITSAYLFAYAVPLLVTGRLGDRFGPRRLYLWGLCAFIVASAMAGLAGSFEVLLGARVLQGLGAAAMTPQSMAIIGRIFAGRELPIAMGLWGTVGGVASISGPLLGGVLVDVAGWEWIFLINVPLGAVALLTAWWWLPVLPAQARRTPLLGVALVLVATFAIVFGIHEGPAHPWWMIGGVIPAPLLVLGGAALLWGYLRRQRGPEDQVLVPVRLFRSRPFTLSAVMVALAAFAVTSMLIPVMLYLQLTLGLSPGTSSYVLIPMGVLAAAVAPGAGALVNRIGPGRVAILGTSLLAASVIAAAVAMLLTAPTWVIAVVMGGYGVANSFVWSPLSVVAMVSAPEALKGSASGVFNTQRQMGALIGAAITGAVFTGAADTLAWAMVPIAAVAVTAAALSPWLARSLRQPAATPEASLAH